MRCTKRSLSRRRTLRSTQSANRRLAGGGYPLAPLAHRTVVEDRVGSELVGCDMAGDNDAGGGGHTQLDHSSEAHVAPDDDVLVPVRIDEDAS